MTIIDSVQNDFTLANSGLATEDLNFIAISNTYNVGNGVYKYDRIIGTNGFGFAIIDTSNQWHYFHIINGNFNSDSVFYIKDNVDLYGKVVGTENGIVQISGDVNNLVFTPIAVQNNDADKKNKKADGSLVSCGKGGYRFVSLGNVGVTRYQVCYGSVTEKSDTPTQLKSWIDGNQLYFESNLDGNYNLDLYDLLGRNIFKNSVLMSNKSSINIPELNVGIYLVNFSNGIKTFSSKVIYTK
jgi:hypothetical protein